MTWSMLLYLIFHTFGIKSPQLSEIFLCTYFKSIYHEIYSTDMVKLKIDV